MEATALHGSEAGTPPWVWFGDSAADSAAAVTTVAMVLRQWWW